ncbi:auxin efflux carrier [Gigaspora margarita]|uniref:Auxin efflux carrier n=2 Tax=Gigaspora margarita TaxID=4874 RepID=A0A8H3WYQ1_GIGMA|nr:auxin efflux carrier [Gigaspora margarita]
MDATLPDLSSIFFASAQSCSQVLLVCFAGYLAAKLELITTNIQKNLSTLIINIFMPCFLFSNVASSVSPETLLSLWPIPTYFVIFTLIGSVLGIFSRPLLKLSNSNTKFVTTGIIFNNVTSLSLGLLRGLEKTDAVLILRWNPDDTPSDIVKRGISYVLLATLWTNLLRWSLGVYLLKKEPSHPLIPQHNNTSEITESDPSKHPDTNEITPLLASKRRSRSFMEKLSRVKSFFSFKFMNPPLYAALIAMVFVSIPPLRSFFFGKNAPLMPLTQAVEYIGSVSVPLTLLTLGAQLKNLSSSKSKSIANMIAYVLTCRLVIMPVIGTVMVLLTKHWYLSDPMLWLILILMASGPTAVNCINLTQLTDNYQEEMSAVLFYGYVVSIPLVTILLMVILSCLKEILYFN